MLNAKLFSVSATLVGAVLLLAGLPARANTGSPAPAGDTTINDSRNQPQGSGTCAGNASSANVRDGQYQTAKDKQVNTDTQALADCSSRWQQLNSNINPDQRNALNAALKTGNVSSVNKVLTDLKVENAQQLASWAVTNVKTGDVKTGDNGILFAPSTSSRDDNRVFAPVLGTSTSPLIPGQDRTIIKDDCGEIVVDSSLSALAKKRGVNLAFFGIALGGDFSSQSFSKEQIIIQEQLIAMLHASLMRSAERSSSYIFARSSILMSLESAQRSGLQIDVSATMAELDSLFKGKPEAWRQARNEAISNRNALCKPVTPPPVYREVPPAPEMVKLCLATSGKRGRTLYSTVFVSSALGLKTGDRYQNSLVTRVEDCSTPF